ncbi:MAG: hypothetical protein ACJ8GN_15945 [Longimicrobiaceae bacterium]
MSDESMISEDDGLPYPPLSQEPEPSQAPLERRTDASGGDYVPVTDPAHAQTLVTELLQHRGQGEGKLIGLAGLSRHGKSEFAKKLRDHLSTGVQSVGDYAKTYAGYINLYYLPARHRRDALLDLAGEEFDQFGDPDVPIRDIAVMTRLLWPVLAKLDGIVLFVSLPLLWSAWNSVDEATGQRLAPSNADQAATRRQTERMVRSIQTLLKYTIVAKQLKQIRNARPALDLPATTEVGQPLPTRAVIDDAFKAGGPLSIPVFIAFSKSDLFRTPLRTDGLRTAPLSIGRDRTRQVVIAPETADPLVLGAHAFPELYRFLEKHVRYFKFDYMQVIHDPSRQPSAEGVDAQAQQRAYADLRGVMPALEFLTEHPWGFPTPGTAAAIQFERRRNPKRWSGAVSALLGGSAPAAAPPAPDGGLDPLWNR